MNVVARLVALLGGILALCFFAVGCENAPPPSPPQAESQPLKNFAEQSEAGHLDHAQPKLPTMELWVGSERVTAEVARTRIEISTGMMFRTEMGENEGMLFIFARPYRASFYMRNTKIPLTCAYIGPDGKILELHKMTPLDEAPVEAGVDQVQYVLEMRQGWFAERGIEPGTVVATEHGSLRETFFSNGF